MPHPKSDYEADLQTIRKFDEANTLVATALAREYDIDNRRWKAILGGPSAASQGTTPRQRKNARNASTMEKVSRLAHDIRTDPESARIKLCKREKTKSQEVEDAWKLMQAAAIVAQSNNPGAAIVNAQMAFSIAAGFSLDEAIRILPGLLYYTHRLGSGQTLVTTITDLIEPVLHGSAPRPISPVFAGAAIGQLACALNEGGRYASASDAFEARQVKQALRNEDELRWCIFSITGNQAVGWAMHGNQQAKAREYLEAMRLQFNSASNLRSNANTLTRLCIQTERFNDAWEIIEPVYASSRLSLEQHRPHSAALSEARPPVLHHVYESMLLGTIARSALAAASYSPDEMARDVSVLEAISDCIQEVTPCALEVGYGVPLRFTSKVKAGEPDLQQLAAQSNRSRLTEDQTWRIQLLIGELNRRSS